MKFNSPINESYNINNESLYEIETPINSSLGEKNIYSPINEKPMSFYFNKDFLELKEENELPFIININLEKYDNSEKSAIPLDIKVKLDYTDFFNSINFDFLSNLKKQFIEENNINNNFNEKLFNYESFIKTENSNFILNESNLNTTNKINNLSEENINNILNSINNENLNINNKLLNYNNSIINENLLNYNNTLTNLINSIKNEELLNSIKNEELLNSNINNIENFLYNTTNLNNDYSELLNIQNSLLVKKNQSLLPEELKSNFTNEIIINNEEKKNNFLEKEMNYSNSNLENSSMSNSINNQNIEQKENSNKTNEISLYKNEESKNNETFNYSAELYEILIRLSRIEHLLNGPIDVKIIE